MEATRMDRKTIDREIALRDATAIEKLLETPEIVDAIGQTKSKNYFNEIESLPPEKLSDRAVEIYHEIMASIPAEIRQKYPQNLLGLIKPQS